MKKKAIISTAASLALAGVMCVGLVACGGGAGAAKSVKGAEITEEAWNAAFSGDTFAETYANFKLEVVIQTKASMSAGGKSQKATMTVSTTYVYAEQKSYVKATTKASASGDISKEEKEALKALQGTVEYYVDESGDDTVFYAKDDDGKWTIDTSDEYDSATETLMELVTEELTSLNFAEYEYSTEYKGYVLKETPSETPGGMPTIVLKFDSEGKLKAVYAEYVRDISGEGASQKTEVTMSYVMTYGGQSVTLPTVA